MLISFLSADLGKKSAGRKRKFSDRICFSFFRTLFSFSAFSPVSCLRFFFRFSELLFGQRPRRGRSPVEHRGTSPYVRPYVRPSVRPSVRPVPPETPASGLRPPASGHKTPGWGPRIQPQVPGPSPIDSRLRFQDLSLQT